MTWTQWAIVIGCAAIVAFLIIATIRDVQAARKRRGLLEEARRTLRREEACRVHELRKRGFIR